MNRLSAHAAQRWPHRILLVMLLALLFRPAIAQDALPPPAPDTLDLVQVVPRPPTIHVFALSYGDGRTATIPAASFIGRAGDQRLTFTQAPASPPTGIATVLLVDVSKSIGRAAFPDVKAVLADWVEKMAPEDRAAIVSFGAGVTTVRGFTDDKAALLADIRNLGVEGDTTQLYGGLARAIDIARRDDASLPMRRAVFVITDGIDDQIGAATAARIQRKLAVDSVPLYVLGLMPNTRLGRGALGMMSSLADDSSGAIAVPERSRPADLMPPYRRLRSWIDGVVHLTAECPNCASGGAAVPVVIAASVGGLTLKASRLATFDGESKQAVPPVQPTDKPLWRVLAEHISIKLNISLNAAIALLLAGFAGVGAGAAAGGYKLYHVYVADEGKPGPDPGTGPEHEPTKKPTKKVPNESGGVTIQQDLIIVIGTRRDAQRLVVTPMGTHGAPAMEMLFEGPVTVGRAADCEIAIPDDDRISGYHCRLTPAGRVILVEDLDSRNGTSVNGVPIEARLHAEGGSVLGVGRTRLRLQLKAAGDA